MCAGRRRQRASLFGSRSKNYPQDAHFASKSCFWIPRNHFGDHFCFILHGFTGIGSRALHLPIFKRDVNWATFFEAAFYLLHVSPWLVFFFVLCFWQRLRSLVRKPLIVFMDTLCIAQHDPILKSKGNLDAGNIIWQWVKTLYFQWTLESL